VRLRARPAEAGTPYFGGSVPRIQADERPMNLMGSILDQDSSYLNGFATTKRAEWGGSERIRYSPSCTPKSSPVQWSVN
jgi:hypothetical protein